MVDVAVTFMFKDVGRQPISKLEDQGSRLRNYELVRSCIKIESTVGRINRKSRVPEFSKICCNRSKAIQRPGDPLGMKILRKMRNV